MERPRTTLARLPFVLVLIGMFAVGMAGLLMLNTTLQNQAIEARQLDTRASQLGYTEAALQRRADELRSPASLAARAATLGLRPNPSPAFLVLPSGTILGEPHPVTGHEQPSLVPTAPAGRAHAKATGKATGKGKVTASGRSRVQGVGEPTTPQGQDRPTGPTGRR